MSEKMIELTPVKLSEKQLKRAEQLIDESEYADARFEDMVSLLELFESFTLIENSLPLKTPGNEFLFKSGHLLESVEKKGEAYILSLRAPAPTRSKNVSHLRILVLDLSDHMRIYEEFFDRFGTQVAIARLNGVLFFYSQEYKRPSA